MEGNLPSNTFNVEEEGGGEMDHSLAIDGVVSVPCVDWFLQPGSREGMLSNKPPVEAGDACTTVYEGTVSKEFPVLKIHDREGDFSHILVFFFIINRFQFG